MSHLGNKINKICRSYRNLAGLIISSTLMVSGCSTVTTQSFTRTANANVEVSYIATDADFGKYHQLLGEDMGIFHPESNPLPEEDLQRIRKIFRDAFMGELSGYEIVDSAGPGVMTVQASLIDLRNADISDVPNLRTGLDKVARPGVLVFLMEMRDSATDRVLARAADSTSNPKIGSGGGGSTTDWDGVQTAARYWASLFRQFLDQNLAQ